MSLVALILVATLVLAWPISRALLRIFDERRPDYANCGGSLERPLLRLLGVNPEVAGGWRDYFVALLLFNVLLGMVACLVMCFQGELPLNPDRVKDLPLDLAVHTAVAFVTNTDQQHYSGQAQLSLLSQCLALITLQFVSPATGLVAAVAMLRALRGGWKPAGQQPGPETPVALGNVWLDLCFSLFRVLLPLSLVLAVMLSGEGVPSTFQSSVLAAPLDEAGAEGQQHIALGPIAALEAIKQIGTNGGGWYGPNSATPLENPTPVANALETGAILLIPMALVLFAGPMLGSPGFGRLAFGVMLVSSAALISVAVVAEAEPNPAAPAAVVGGNLEGKELRIGTNGSALWAALTTQTSSGSVNAMMDSMQPATIAAAFCAMFVNAIWGGIGCGLIGFVVHLLVVIFLAGLMVGRTPEFLGRKLDVTVVQGLAVLVVLPPLVIFGFSALTLCVPGLAGNSNPGMHGIAQVVYEYTSAFANNGSGLEGLADATPWWNLSCAVVMLLGRYLPLALPLAIAASLGQRRPAPLSPASLRLDSPLFMVTTLAMISLLTLLTFLPALMLGPIGEALSRLADNS